MKKPARTILALLFAAAVTTLGASCGSDEVIKKETTRETVSSPYGYGTSSSSTTTTTTVIDD